MQSTSLAITKLSSVAIAPEITDSGIDNLTSPPNFGAPILSASSVVSTSAHTISAKIPFPVGASLVSLTFAVTGADLQATDPAAPDIDVSISTAATAPTDGTILDNYSMTNYTVNKAEVVSATDFTNFTNAQGAPRSAYLYVTSHGTYVLANAAVYTVYYSYTLPI